MDTIGKIKRSNIGGYFITAKVKVEYGFKNVCMVWGDDYTVNYGISSKYEIHIIKNGNEISVLDVDDYTCKPWK